MTLETSPTQILEQLVEISRQAGQAILAWYDGDMGITHKADDSPLTKADLASHELIVAELAAAGPISRYCPKNPQRFPGKPAKNWQQYWLVDPLDGTKEFINRNGEFTVNIALIREHRPVMGVVHVPVTDVSYFGAIEVGAWRQQGA